MGGTLVPGPGGEAGGTLVPCLGGGTLVPGLGLGGTCPVPSPVQVYLSSVKFSARSGGGLSSPRSGDPP